MLSHEDRIREHVKRVELEEVTSKPHLKFSKDELEDQLSKLAEEKEELSKRLALETDVEFKTRLNEFNLAVLDLNKAQKVRQTQQTTAFSRVSKLNEKIIKQREILSRIREEKALIEKESGFCEAAKVCTKLEIFAGVKADKLTEYCIKHDIEYEKYLEQFKKLKNPSKVYPKKIVTPSMLKREWFKAGPFLWKEWKERLTFLGCLIEQDLTRIKENDILSGDEAYQAAARCRKIFKIPE